MNGEVVEYLAALVEGLSDDEREALWARLAAKRPRPMPVIAGEPRPLPEPRRATGVSARIEWV